MLKISQTAQRVPASPIRKLVPFAEAAKKRGVKVYHLNIGQPDVATPDLAMKAIHNIDIKVIEYTHSAGIESYRRELANFYNERDIKVDFSDIIVTTGGSEAIIFGMLTVCNPGDQIIIPEPFYANYNGFAAQVGVEIIPIKSCIDNGFALPTSEEFEKLITPRTRAIMICNPNNPTGYLYSQQEIEDLGRLVKKHDLYLLSDEVYSDFCYDGKKHYSVLSLEGVDDNVILFDSVSKRYSMCGVRIGAFVSRNCQVMDAVMRLAQARLCPPYIAQIACQAALKTPKSYFQEVKAEYVARRNYLVGELQKMEGVICPMPSGAFYAIAKLPIDNADRFAKWLLEEFQFQGATVMVAPATGFYSNPETSGLQEVRIAYVLEIEELKGAMATLEAALKAYPGRTI